MQKILQPYCLCSKNKLTKNSIICSSLPNELILRQTLHSASVLLNLEGVYIISKYSNYDLMVIKIDYTIDYAINYAIDYNEN